MVTMCMMFWRVVAGLANTVFNLVNSNVAEYSFRCRRFSITKNEITITNFANTLLSPMTWKNLVSIFYHVFREDFVRLGRYETTSGLSPWT